MAREKKRKEVQPEVETYDDSKYLDDDLKYAEPVLIEEEPVEAPRPQEEKKKPKKTLTERYRYKGKYELLPERELRKQLRFYQRVFNYRWLGILSGVCAIFFAAIATKYNHYFSLFTLLIVISGLIYGVFGLIKIRRFGLILVLLGVVLNVVAIIMVINPLKLIIADAAEIVQLINDYISSIGGA